MYRFVKSYSEYLGIEVEEFLYSALCYSLEELIRTLRERAEEWGIVSSVASIDKSTLNDR